MSHRVQKRVRGPLHKETLYGQLKLKNEKGVTLYAVRKKLEDLTPAMINKIADPVVRRIVKDHLRSHNIDPDAKGSSIPSRVFKNQVLYMKTRKTQSDNKIPIKKVRIHQPFNNIILFPKHEKTGVEPGNNHHVVLYRYKDSKGHLKQDGEICTLFEAVRRLTRGEPVIQRNLDNGREFLCSLAINEMVLLGMEESEVDWENPLFEELSKNLYRVQKISINEITLRHHLVAVLKDDLGEEPGLSRPTLSSFKGIKVRIDRIGRIHKAHD